METDNRVRFFTSHVREKIRRGDVDWSHREIREAIDGLLQCVDLLASEVDALKERGTV